MHSQALKAVVQAMHRELARQAQTSDFACVALPPHSPGNASDVTLLSGHFDLTKVARAGLLAMRHPDAYARRAYDAVVAIDGAVAPLDVEAFGSLIDAVVAERP